MADTPLPPELKGLDPGELLARALNFVEPSASAGPWVPPTPEELNRLLPQYRVESLLGRGGMGAVYKATQPTLDRPVAIKLLSAGMSAQEPFVLRFQREARTLAQLQHPGIVTIYESGRIGDGHLYFVMEYVEGTDLRRILQGPGLNPDQALELTGQICDALQAAHRQGVIHRDIKPENILISSDGHAKLADFGLSRPISEDTCGLTCTNMVMGTPDYMSPEQRTGDADERTDVFALGVVLYEMLTGRPPLGAFDPPSRKVPVDVRLDEVVIKALQEQPSRRYQQISEMKTAVDHIRFTPPPSIAPPTARKPRARNMTMLAAAAVLLLGVAGLCLWPKGDARGSDKSQTLTATTNEPASALPTAEVANEEMPAPANPAEETIIGKSESANSSHSDVSTPAAAQESLAVPPSRTVEKPAVQPRKSTQTTAVAEALPAAQPGRPWTNSLGMKFVPVPGTAVLFSIWDTRVQDYQAFVTAMGRPWEKPHFEQGPTHPAVMVGWEAAIAFCTWLTKNERRAGTLTSAQEYRLPTDSEWSAAVGLEIENGSTPEEKRENGENLAVYPWGRQWPPPRGAGNYSKRLNVDECDNTSPVGSFPENRFGLFDMSGNVWQWCGDRWNSRSGHHVLRGGAYGSASPKDLLSSFRRHDSLHDSAGVTRSNYGFRCVLAGGGAVVAQVQSSPTSIAATPPPPPAPSLPALGNMQTQANQNPTKILSQQALNATVWVLAPLDQSVPGDIRQNLTDLREDLLDEGKAAPKTNADAYKLGSQLCNNLLATLDERDQACVRAGYRAAQADANTKVTSQALEARRNHMMSWPQYAREQDQRGEIQRQQTNGANLVKESVKVDWANKSAVLRKALDAQYARYRDALRQGGK